MFLYVFNVFNKNLHGEIYMSTLNFPCLQIYFQVYNEKSQCQDIHVSKIILKVPKYVYNVSKKNIHSDISIEISLSLYSISLHDSLTPLS